jgi:hypothetical protein
LENPLAIEHFDAYIRSWFRGELVMSLANLPPSAQRSGYQRLAALILFPGRYFAYQSDESGRREIYVRPFPGPGAKLTISNDGGDSPRWAASGEIFYRSANRMMAVSIETAQALRAGKPKMLFEARNLLNEGRNLLAYDVDPGGKPSR